MREGGLVTGKIYFIAAATTTTTSTITTTTKTTTTTTASSSSSGLVHLLSNFALSFCWSRINSIRFEMWCSTGLSSGTLFVLHTQSLGNVICLSGHLYHFFADDSQLHNSSTPSDFPALVHSLKDCVEDVAEWMCGS